MKKILITGAAGQIGTELTEDLRKRYGRENVIASDVCMPTEPGLSSDSIYDILDVTDSNQITRVMQKYEVGIVYHLAALLSASGESRPNLAWKVNVNGLYNILEAARQYQCALFFPSSIGAFGPNTPKDNTPQDTIMKPNTMYGITKVTGELLCDYYYKRFGIDTRGLRFPGLISHETEPGGGTTDYAVSIFYDAIRYRKFTCYLKPDTCLDMMYMPDAVRAMIELMEANSSGLIHRNSFNLTAMNFTPAEIAEEIRKHIPEFEIEYEIDPVRQAIADSWPNYMDDSCARQEWGWKPEYDLPRMTKEMIEVLSRKLWGECSFDVTGRKL